MDLAARQARVGNALLREHGVAGVYAVGGLGDPIPLQAIDTPDAEAAGKSGLVEFRHEIHIARSALADAPARGDTVTLGGEVFIVQQHEPDGPFWRLIVRKGGS